jgi:hypothetical protein
MVVVKRVALCENIDELSQGHLDVMRYEAAVENPGLFYFSISLRYTLCMKTTGDLPRQARAEDIV